MQDMSAASHRIVKCYVIREVSLHPFNLGEEVWSVALFELLSFLKGSYTCSNIELICTLLKRILANPRPKVSSDTCNK